MALFINPGSGPVEGATEAQAAANMAWFAQDLRTAGHVVGERIESAQARSGDGRFPFLILVDGVEHLVDMPGLPIEAVRWVDEPEQNIWDFPRLYVDGSSWVWKFALDVVGPDR